jgi:hypothetical protein
MARPFTAVHLSVASPLPIISSRHFFVIQLSHLTAEVVEQDEGRVVQCQHHSAFLVPLEIFKTKIIVG